MIKSYRGLITTDAGGDSTSIINLHTKDGKTGYKIVKLKIIPKDPTDTTNESVLQIFTVPTASTDEINFDNPTLLGCAYWSNHLSGTIYPEDTVVIFDNTIFNQDIHLTCKSDTGDTSMNYYIELEQISLTEDQALVAIVKNLRNKQ